MYQKWFKPVTTLLLVIMIATLFAGCAPVTPMVIEQTVVVKETVPVTVRETVPVTVKETVSVMVTPTPVPPPIKSSGPVSIGTGGMTGKHLIPIWLTSNPQFMVMPLILPALTWFDNNVQPVPDLATKIDVNKDATLYTFTINDKAVWSDGKPVTAQDVAFTYKLAVNPGVANSSWNTNFGKIKGVDAYKKDPTLDIEGIKVIDDKTISIELTAPNASFLYNTYLGILPEHILGSVKVEDLEKDPFVDAPIVTSGPYDFVKFEAGQYIQLKKKANYWGKQVNIDEIFVKLFESSATMLAQLEAGEIQLATLPPEEVARFKTMSHIDVMTVQGIGYYVTHFDFRTAETIAKFNLPVDQGGKGYNNTRGPRVYQQDKRFRQAIAYAIDNSAVIKVVAGGEAQPIYSSIFGPAWAVNPDLNTYEKNVDKAKALLTEVGVTFDAKGAALWEGKPIVMVYLSNTSEEARKLGEVLQQQLAGVGIRLDIKLVTSSAFLQAAYNGEGDLIRNAGGRFGADPSISSLYYTCKAGWAESVIGYCNPAFDELMNKGVATSDQAERAEIYKQASAILNDELPSLYYYTANVFVGANKGLTGLNPSSDPGYLTWNIQDWNFTK